MINAGELRKRKRQLAVLVLALAWWGPGVPRTNHTDGDQAAEAVLNGPAHAASAQAWGELDFAKAHPELIGDKDGALASARDEANRLLLPRQRAVVEAVRGRLAREVAADRFHGEFNNKASDLWYAQRRLEGLAAVEQALAAQPGSKLMVLDMRSGERGKAAIAVGDPDTADHIAVTVPGVDSSPGQTIAGMVEEAAKLKSSSESILREQGSAETVAAIAWIGYEPPQFNWDGSNPGPDWGDELKGAVELTKNQRARIGADSLARFYQGLAAVWRPALGSSAKGPRITALCHSYGSFVVSLALQQLPKGIVTDTVFYGAPGIEAAADGGAEQLSLEPGHVFAMASEDDPIRRLSNWLSQVVFGGNPVHLPWVERLSTHEGDGPGDGLRHKQAHGHADYPRTADNGELYMTGYNMAAVVAGRSDLAVHGD